MSNLFEFTSGVSVYGPDDFNFVTKFFEFTSDLNNYSQDDFTFVTRLFTFADPPQLPDPVYFSFDVEGYTPPPPGTAFDPTIGIILSFRDPKTLNPYNAMKITGLDASKIKAKYYRGSFGDKFYDLKLESRQITALIGLNPNFRNAQSYSDLRDFVYKIISFSPSGEVKLYFKNGTKTVAVLYGFASKVDTTLFEQNQEIELTIDCDDPVFKAPSETVVNVELFGSPFSLQDPDSTAPHGFIFQLQLDTDTPDLTITDPDDDTWFFKIAPSTGFLNGDMLYFSSEFNNRYLYVVRGSSVIDMMPSVTSGSVWPIMFPGVNNFSLSLTNLGITWRKISYVKSYWGV